MLNPNWNQTNHVRHLCISIIQARPNIWTFYIIYSNGLRIIYFEASVSLYELRTWDFEQWRCAVDHIVLKKMPSILRASQDLDTFFDPDALVTLWARKASQDLETTLILMLWSHSRLRSVNYVIMPSDLKIVDNSGKYQCWYLSPVWVNHLSLLVCTCNAKILLF